MNKKSLLKVVLNVIIAILLVGVGLVIGARWFGSSAGLDKQMMEQLQQMSSFMPKSKLAKTLTLIENKYVEPVDVDTLSEQFIGDLLKKLDPHSVFIAAKDFESSNENLQGEFYGIGVVFNMATDTAIIQNVISGGPAAKVGIFGGDRIIEVGDSVVAGRKFDQNNLVKMLKGKGGTPVTVRIERYGVDDLMEFEIIRDKIPIKSIDAAYMVNDTVGYIKLLQFSRTTHSEFVAAVEDLTKKGMKSLIFDLSGNSGGYLDQAILIANEFLPKGKMIVYTEGRGVKYAEQFSDGRGKFTNQELVVMIDEGSASSSEIVAGALQDNDRGTLVGRRSFGKGLVQEQIPFPDGAAINLTIARYHTPTGRCIQRPYDKGIEEYYSDFYNRYKNSELFSVDSISFADSLKFTTPMGKTVYGGGGIMPDVFVPLDTTLLSKEVQSLMRDNTLFTYSLRYTDAHRKELLAIETLTELEEFFADNSTALYSGFVNFAKSSKKRVNLTAKDKEVVLDYLMAYIARNSGTTDNGFYLYFNKLDNIFDTALSEVRR